MKQNKYAQKRETENDGVYNEKKTKFRPLAGTSYLYVPTHQREHEQNRTARSEMKRRKINPPKTC
jgi:hypothetical protein